MILCANPSAQFNSYQAEIESAVIKVMRSNKYVLGSEVEALESEFAEYIGVDSAIGVANGTDAIELALRSLDVGYGDEVITVSHSAVATVAAIESTGASAVLIDIEPDFYTIQPSMLEEAFTKNTKAVVAVHIYGQACDLDSIVAFCNKNKIFLIEDVAQAHGAKYKEKRLGSIGDIGCFSCYPTKNLGAIGDAGLITTNNKNLSKKIRMLREYGWSKRISIFSGRNSRLDELQASILRIKLKYLDSDNSKRNQLANFYSSELENTSIITPKNRNNSTHVYHLFVIQELRRDELINHLKKDNIFAGIHYPVPIHHHPAYLNRLKVSSNMKVTESLVEKILSLPIYPELKIEDAEKVVKSVKNFQDQY